MLADGAEIGGRGDLSGRGSAGLPGEEELYRRYRRFRAEYFGGAVPPASDVTIQWSDRLISSAGRCYSKQRVIRLSTHYHVKYPEEVDKTLLHEMIHLIVPNHGPLFYGWMERIRQRGGQVERYAKERATPRVDRWRYTCNGCGMQAKRQRRLAHGGIHHRCKGCGGTLMEDPLV